MKNLVTLLAIVLLMGTPCRSQEKASAPNSSTKVEGTDQQKNQYQQKMEEKLRDLDKEVDELEAKAAEQSEQAKKQYARQMTELDRKRKAARRKLDKFENSSEAAWRDMKPGIDAAMKDLETAYKRAASHFN